MFLCKSFCAKIAIKVRLCISLLLKHFIVCNYFTIVSVPNKNCKNFKLSITNMLYFCTCNSFKITSKYAKNSRYMYMSLMQELPRFLEAFHHFSFYHTPESDQIATGQQGKGQHLLINSGQFDL